MQELLQRLSLRHIATWFASLKILACVICDSSMSELNGRICTYCNESFLQTSLKVVQHYGYDIPVYSCAKYDGIAVQFIASKYKNKWQAYEPMAHIMASSKTIPWHEFDYMVPVPMHYIKRLQRGYNHTDELALHLKNKTGLQIRQLVYKKMNTQPQASLSYEDRKKNITGTFGLSELDIAEIAGKKIVLVDDVYTSGNTVQEMVRVLWQARPLSISVVVFARS